MPADSSQRPVAEKYALDYSRRPLATRLWKSRWNWFALLASVLIVASLYAVRREEAFQAGPVSPAHVAAGASCHDCHDQSWQPALRLARADSNIHSVSDAACRECHQVANHHHTLGSPGHECASCHQEHRGGEILTRVLDSQCITCHGDLDKVPQATQGFHANIKQFTPGSAEHPEFALLRNEATTHKDHGVWSVATFDAHAGGKWLDRGGLKFNHKVHLASEGVLDADRKPIQLQCADCHTEDTSGQYMAPIRYEQHCSKCHPLRLAGDFAALGDLAHEAPETVRALLRERLAEEEEAVATEKKSTRIPLLPKPTLLSAEQKNSVDQRLAQAEHAVIGLEAKGMCRKCHHIEIDQNNWKVLHLPPATNSKTVAGEPTMVPDRWLRHGRFDHSAHRAVDCGTCHQAADSERTADILLPSIATCRTCHGAVVTTMATGVSDDCVLCHDFHNGAGAALADSLAEPP